MGIAGEAPKAIPLLITVLHAGPIVDDVNHAVAFLLSNQALLKEHLVIILQPRLFDGCLFPRVGGSGFFLFHLT